MILELIIIQSPIAQPRNAIIGQIQFAVIGVGIIKLFKLDDVFVNLRWLAGALVCGLASAAMTATNTVYPSAGPTAILAAVDPQVEHLDGTCCTGTTQYSFDVINVAGDQQYPTAVSYLLVDPCKCWEGF